MSDRQSANQSSPEELASRSAYVHWTQIPTRWMDNDIYGHVNNVQYYSFFDTVINRYLIREGELDPVAGGVIGLAVETHCQFHASLSFPQDVDAGLRVGKLGRTSVRYDIGLFAPDSPTPAATGHFVHVFVDRVTRIPADMPTALRSCLERLRV